MGKIAIFVMIFTAAIFAGEYAGNCAPVLQVSKNGVVETTEPIFMKSACPTQDELEKGVQRYLEVTGQASRPYILIRTNHGGYILHFTD